MKYTARFGQTGAMRMANTKAANYLDYVPMANPKNNWDEKDGVVTIHMIHRGF